MLEGCRRAAPTDRVRRSRAAPIQRPLALHTADALSGACSHRTGRWASRRRVAPETHGAVLRSGWRDRCSAMARGRDGPRRSRPAHEAARRAIRRQQLCERSGQLVSMALDELCHATRGYARRATSRITSPRASPAALLSCEAAIAATRQGACRALPRRPEHVRPTAPPVATLRRQGPGRREQTRCQACSGFAVAVATSCQPKGECARFAANARLNPVQTARTSGESSPAAAPSPRSSMSRRPRAATASL